MTIALLICVAALLTFAYLRVWPNPYRKGPFLPDTYLLGLAIYAAGALFVAGTTTIADADVLATMALLALISSLAGAILFCVAFGKTYARSSAEPRFAPSIVEIDRKFTLVIATFSTLACVYFIYRLSRSPIVSQFLSLRNLINSDSLRYARAAVEHGTAGYMAPGYIKQFRDTLLPISLFAMIFLLVRPFKSPIFIGTLLATILAMFINGVRSPVIFLLLGLWLSVAYRQAQGGAAVRSTRSRVRYFVTIASLVLVFWIGLSAALGRSGGKDASAFDIPLNAVAGLADRVVVAPAIVNAQTYQIWGHMGPIGWEFWGATLASITKSNGPNQEAITHLANYLSFASGSGPLGNAPLYLPPDVWMVGGWVWLAIIPAIYAFLIGLLDIALASERSPLFLSMRIYMFFELPLCVSPYLFILYGGAMCLMLIAGLKAAYFFASRQSAKRVEVGRLPHGAL